MAGKLRSLGARITLQDDAAGTLHEGRRKGAFFIVNI